MTWRIKNKNKPRVGVAVLEEIFGVCLLHVWAKAVLSLSFFLSQTFFPSGYFIPLTHCTHGTKAECSNKEKAGVCSVQHTAYSSPITGECPGNQARGKARASSS